MSDDPGPFHELVSAQQKINPEDGKLENEGGEKTERHRIAPHINHVANQTETAVAAGTEYARNQRGVDGGSHDVVGVDEQHIFQVVHSRFA